MPRPRRTVPILAALIVVAVATPVAWYLGSPVFLRVELEEPPVSAFEPATGPIVETVVARQRVPRPSRAARRSRRRLRRQGFGRRWRPDAGPMDARPHADRAVHRDGRLPLRSRDRDPAGGRAGPVGRQARGLLGPQRPGPVRRAVTRPGGLRRRRRGGRPAAGDRWQLQHARPGGDRRLARPQRPDLVQAVLAPVRRRAARRLREAVRRRRRPRRSGWAPLPGRRAATRPRGPV